MESVCEQREAELVLWHRCGSSLEQLFPLCPTRGCWTCPVLVTSARRGQDRGQRCPGPAALPCRRSPPLSPLLHFYFPPTL